jgi:hypothetical protein
VRYGVAHTEVIRSAYQKYVGKPEVTSSFVDIILKWILKKWGVSVYWIQQGKALAVDSCKCVTNFQIFMWLGEFLDYWLFKNPVHCSNNSSLILRKSVIHLWDASRLPVCKVSAIWKTKLAQHEQGMHESPGGDVSPTSNVRWEPRVKWITNLL